MSTAQCGWPYATSTVARRQDCGCWRYVARDEFPTQFFAAAKRPTRQLFMASLLIYVSATTRKNC